EEQKVTKACELMSRAMSAHDTAPPPQLRTRKRSADAESAKEKNTVNQYMRSGFGSSAASRNGAYKTMARSVCSGEVKACTRSPTFQRSPSPRRKLSMQRNVIKASSQIYALK